MDSQPTTRHTDLSIVAADVALAGNLAVPVDAAGLVIFAHGSGSGRLSVRNRHVAEMLNAEGLATLLFDLLTADEEAVDTVTYHLRFDIPLLTDRLTFTLDWVKQQRDLWRLPIGLFGASTGAAAALGAAAARPDLVAAVVSRGGRPDLAGAALARVKAPTLLVVGGNDHPVIEMNRAAAARMTCPHRIEIVPGASHLFEEAGALDQVARLARDWFVSHLRHLGEKAA